ncbi:MAG: SMI1/KNR4 family protein [Chitinophaga sp.]|uniref:SMI1/KNR4 family protein n=1 Tax=Chitinophaga sp. TaxID=1869181 RepID=UPI0025C160A6|nr:SMI1/KNR4 family protein [Chitinophaga sp.]MBV8251632.1 SMI1/KNR4 family protein [Chitinophaga sp.]
MLQFGEQIERIKKKLLVAAKIDSDRHVFGASSHQYHIGETLDEAAVSEFEKTHQISLPACFKAFLCKIGNGGKSQLQSAAGPFYGIYPLGENLNEICDPVYLRRPVKIYPHLTDEYWEDLTKSINDDDISDEDYDAALGSIYAGILPIGSQGCTYIHGLILNGPHEGKVVNLDLDRQKPIFTFEATFLDWYERWLDEIISGELTQGQPTWFGYRMGGPVATLLALYKSASDKVIKLDCLNGILGKHQVDADTVKIFEKEYQSATDDYKELWLQILSKFNYQVAKPYLVTTTNLLCVYRFIFWYAKDKSQEWREHITQNIHQITDEETFRFCTYLLFEMNFDYGPLIVPMLRSSNSGIRQTAIYTLGKLKHKSVYIDTFIEGLHDNSNNVIHSSLQALSDIKDKRLLPHYKLVAERFPEETGYILSNLRQRLQTYGLTLSDIKKRDY